MKYLLPPGVFIKEPVPEKYNQETILTFIDEKHGEFTTNFRAFVKSKGLSTHPKAVAERRERTNIEKYGSKTPAGNKTVLKKMKQTTLKNYGVENVSSSEVIKEKKKTTSLNNYGVENPMKSDVVKQKQIQTVLEKYNVRNVMFNEKVQNKHRQVQIESGHVKVLPNGNTIAQEYKAQNKPHKANAHVVYNNLGPEAALEWITNYTKGKYSSLEMFAKEHIDILEPFQKRIGIYSPDFVVNGKNTIYVDVDGLLWHSDKPGIDKPKDFHFKKRVTFESKSQTILQFHQDEIVYKYPIVESIIKAKAGLLKNKINARQCVIDKVDAVVASKFLLDNHLMGNAVKAKNLGLFYKDQLVSLLTYKRVKNTNGLDIVRFCNILDTNVRGGLDRLLKHLEKLEKPEFIQSFVDLRYGNGNSLKRLGFTLQSCAISFKWCDLGHTYHRSQCTADKSRNLTEKENAALKGWNKIYDAGQAKWVKLLSK